jgi:legumain
MAKITFVLLLAHSLGTASGAHWAVIMAGSNTYSNYRHQADACHAYQIAKKNGIPESNIIMLAYDDIASSRSNPFPGKMFNKPTPKGTPGVDVYEGCKIDYKGAQVTGANFLKVLSGDTSAPGPVLKSGSKDHVFVYYTDHGGVGILGVPNGAAGGYIHAADINKAISTLQSKGGYKELLFYLEACESGSIFANLLKAPNAKAITAANAKESSWGWYCAGSGTGGDMVDGKAINSCLGDEFSVRWMEDTEAADVSSETVGQQFTKIVKAVTKSHVQQYGVTAFDSEPIGDFQGSDGSNSVHNATPTMNGNGVDSRTVEVHQAYYRVVRAETPAVRKEAESELAEILARRHSADKKFGNIASIAMKGDAAKAEQMLEGNTGTLEDVACHQMTMEVAATQCGPFTDYSLRYSRLFANLCDSEVDEKSVVSAIQTVCGQQVVV